MENKCKSIQHEQFSEDATVVIATDVGVPTMFSLKFFGNLKSLSYNC